MPNEDLRQAIELLHSGKTKEAQKALESILKAQPGNIQSWFWYVETWPSTAHRIQILEACLRCNPNNTQVKQALAALSSQNAKIEAVKPDPGSKETVPDLTANSSGVGSTPRAALSMQEPAVWADKVQVAASPQITDLPGRPKGSSRPNWFLWGSALVLLAFCAVIGVIGLNSFSIPKDPSQYRHDQPNEYYLYAPKDYSPDRSWPLFIGIHGSGGTGLDCWNWWQAYADQEGFILLCPSIADSSGGWYQTDGETKVFNDINQLQGAYRLKPREFLVGFSAGAQFVQGFAFRYPQYVSGVAILSAGNYYTPPLGARSIPFLVVIGDQDDPVSILGSAAFSATLGQNGFDVQYQVLPGVGHTVTDQGKQLTIALFRKSEGR